MNSADILEYMFHLITHYQNNQAFYSQYYEGSPLNIPNTLDWIHRKYMADLYNFTPAQLEEYLIDENGTPSITDDVEDIDGRTICEEDLSSLPSNYTVPYQVPAILTALIASFPFEAHAAFTAQAAAHAAAQATADVVQAVQAALPAADVVQAAQLYTADVVQAVQAAQPAADVVQAAQLYTADAVQAVQATFPDRNLITSTPNTWD
jgi:hypothetical protein